jgi:hypothetical protein
MPILKAPTDPKDGVRVTVRIGLTGPDTARRRRQGLAIPQPVVTEALLDTGAECTFVVPRVVTQLGLLWRTPGLVGAPAAGGFGGTVSYEAGVAIVHPSGDPKLDLVFPALTIQEVTQLAGFGVDVVLGRDVLASCVLVYDGPAGAATLAY